MSKHPSSWFLYGAAALVVIGLIVFATLQTSAPSPYERFVQCLTDKGVKMFGAWWCPHCQNQKKLFEGAFEKINYIECSLPNRQMNQTCRDAGIEGYPTWEFADGSRVSGETTLQTLAEKTACELQTK